MAPNREHLPKYSDGSLTFWNKGATATFQRGDAPSVACRELGAESLLADGRERGVLYRGTGNEPGWIAEIGADGGILFVTDYGHARHEFPGPTQQGGVAGGDIVYAGADGADRIRVIIRKEPCFDDMSGEEFDHRVVVEHGGRELRGCATVPQQAPVAYAPAGGVYHVVESGSTLWRISKTYGVDIHELMRVNRFAAAEKRRPRRFDFKREGDGRTSGRVQRAAGLASEGLRHLLPPHPSTNGGV